MIPTKRNNELSNKWWHWMAARVVIKLSYAARLSASELWWDRTRYWKRMDVKDVATITEGEALLNYETGWCNKTGWSTSTVKINSLPRRKDALGFTSINGLVVRPASSTTQVFIHEQRPFPHQLTYVTGLIYVKSSCTKWLRQWIGNVHQVRQQKI